MDNKMDYKGFKIVEQWKEYQIWADGNQVTDYEPEFDAYMVWDEKNNWQHEDFPEAYDTEEEAKHAINAFLAVNKAVEVAEQ